MIDLKISAISAVRTLTGGTVGTVLIAEGFINASTGPILAGMVTIIGTAAVVVYGQLATARNKALAEQETIKTKAMADQRRIDFEADTAERSALLKDYQDEKVANQKYIRELQDRLIDAERRAQWGTKNQEEQKDGLPGIHG